MESIKELKEQKEEITIQLNDLRSTVETDKRAFTDDELQSWDELSNALNALDQSIQTQERILNSPKPEEKSKVVAFSSSSKPVNNDEIFRGWCWSQQNRKENITPSAIEGANRSGIRFDEPLSAPIKWNQTVADGTASGSAVNEAVVAGVVNKLKDYSGVMSVSNVFSTENAAPLKKVVHDHTSFLATKTAELGTIANTTQTLETVSFGATEYTSGIYQISHQILRDSAYPIMDEFQNAMAESFGRAWNDVFTNGDGVGDPQGCEVAASTALSVDGTADVSLANLQTLQHSIDSAYRRSPKCVYMCSDSTVLELKGSLIDADGRPTYNQSQNSNVNVPMAMMIEGFPVVINPSMTDGVILFGDFSRFHIRTVGNLTMRMLTELYALQNAVALVGHQAVDSRLVDSGAIKKLART